MKPVCVVTGAAQGIAFAVCQELAAQGWDVAMCDVQELSKWAGAVEEVRGLGADARAYQVDIGNSPSVAAAAAAIDKDFPGRVKGLANVAGIVSRTTPGEESDDEWARHLNINVVGTARVTKFIAPLMAQAGGGGIVTISSLAARFGAEAAALCYTAAKAALIGMSKQFAKMYAKQGIRSNCIAPGPVQTPMLDWDEATRERFRNATLLKRIAVPEDIASAVAFLLSDKARHITAATLDVNGGQYVGS